MLPRPPLCLRRRVVADDVGGTFADAAKHGFDVDHLSCLYLQVLCKIISATKTKHYRHPTFESTHAKTGFGDAFVFVVCSIGGNGWFRPMTPAHRRGYETEISFRMK